MSIIADIMFGYIGLYIIIIGCIIAILLISVSPNLSKRLKYSSYTMSFSVIIMAIIFLLIS
ncbi:MAG: hypothetical protein ACTSRP_11325 [Candidatus Helarchaeota archaeon]